jgi:hypothetical protein
MRQDGRPHVVPIWFDLDGERIVFTTWHNRRLKRPIFNAIPGFASVWMKKHHIQLCADRRARGNLTR